MVATAEKQPAASHEGLQFLRPKSQLVIMKIFSFFILLLTIGCSQKSNKKIAEPESPKVLPPDTVTIDYNLPAETYLVEADTSYFYTTPEESSRSGIFLLKKDLIMSYRKNGDFVYSVVSVDSADKPHGWIKAKDIKKVLFTPPKVVSE